MLILISFILVFPKTQPNSRIVKINFITLLYSGDVKACLWLIVTVCTVCMTELPNTTVLTVYHDRSLVTDTPSTTSEAILIDVPQLKVKSS